MAKETPRKTSQLTLQEHALLLLLLSLLVLGSIVRYYRYHPQPEESEPTPEARLPAPLLEGNNTHAED